MEITVSKIRLVKRAIQSHTNSNDTLYTPIIHTTKGCNTPSSISLKRDEDLSNSNVINGSLLVSPIYNNDTSSIDNCGGAYGELKNSMYQTPSIPSPQPIVTSYQYNSVTNNNSNSYEHKDTDENIEVYIVNNHVRVMEKLHKVMKKVESSIQNHASMVNQIRSIDMLIDDEVNRFLSTF